MSNWSRKPVPGKQPWHRELFVWMLILIPFSAVVMAAVAITLAITSDDGVVVDDYYKHGLEINRVLERDKAASEYALLAKLRLRSALDRIELTLQAEQSFRRPDVLLLSLYHATRHGFDRQLFLERTTYDGYTSALPELAAGDWHLQLEADDWRLTGTFNVPRDKEVRMAHHRPS